MASLNNQPLDLRFMGALRLRKPDSWSAGRICQKTCILLASARKAKRTDGFRSISKIGFSVVAQKYYCSYSGYSQQAAPDFRGEPSMLGFRVTLMVSMQDSRLQFV